MKVWWDIGEEFLNRLIDSKPRRAQALLEAEVAIRSIEASILVAFVFIISKCNVIIH